MQVMNLEESHLAHPNTTWWIKADGCDVVKGLFESHVEHHWAGDVDLNDGALDDQHSKYMEKVALIEKIRSGSTPCLTPSSIQSAQRILSYLNDEVEFINAGITYIYI